MTVPDFEMSAETLELIAERDRAAEAYYSSGDPVMSDDAFDALATELARRGVAEQVGHGAAGGKVAHLRPMLSLKKVHDVADLEAMLAKHPGADFTVEPKWDGLAVSVRYNGDGELHLAVRRGDGAQGHDITEAIRSIFASQQLPLTLPARREAEVRGEIVMNRSSFARLNAARSLANEPLLSNPRNAASGLISRAASAQERLSDAVIGTEAYNAARGDLLAAAAEAGRWLSFLTYDVDGYADALRVSLASDVHSAPFDNFWVSPFAQFTIPQSDGVASAVAWLETYADQLGVETDGVVVKFTDPALRAALGESSSAPRWALAYKYPNRPMRTILRAVEWAETRTGRIVPTAVFDEVAFPVEDGTPIRVSRATLNNVAFLEELDVWIGDTIEVTRANEVIPNVVRRVGEHAAGASPVLDPNGWPVGAGEILSMEVVKDDLGDPFLQTDVALPAHSMRLNRGELSLPSQKVRLFTDDDEVTRLEGATFFDRADGSESWSDGSIFLIALTDVMPAAVADIASMMLTRQLRSQDDPHIRYRRHGRDFVHDSGRDPVKDISFAAAMLDILGLGENVVRRLFAANPNIGDFPALLDAARESSIAPFERGTQKLVDKLQAEMVSKTSGAQDPAKWIAAAGVPNIGVRAGRKLAKHMLFVFPPTLTTSPFDVLARQTEASIETIDGFGPAQARAVVEARDIWRDWSLVDIAAFTWDWSRYWPAEAGLGERTSAGASELPLAGKRVLVTGTLPTLSRKQAEARIEALGGDVASSVSKNLDLLIAGEKAGSKLAKAEALGVDVMGAAEFEEMNA